MASEYHRSTRRGTDRDLLIGFLNNVVVMGSALRTDGSASQRDSTATCTDSNVSRRQGAPEVWRARL